MADKLLDHTVSHGQRARHGQMSDDPAGKFKETQCPGPTAVEL